MQWLYLVLSTLLFINVLVTIKPIRILPISNVVFAIGWIYSELTIGMAALSVIITLVLIFLGALGTIIGIIASVLTGISWLGLGYILSISLKSQKYFDKALEEGLGHGLDKNRMIKAGSNSKLYLPFTNHPKDITINKDINYAGDDMRRHQLDVYTYRKDENPATDLKPVFFTIHGGAWMIGNKEQQARPIIHTLTKNGFVCVSINYRLSPKATWPDHIVDVKRALVWTKENIASFGGDPNKIIVSGGSAGGHLCALSGLSQNDPSFQSGFEDKDTSIFAAVPIYGVVDLIESCGVNVRDLTKLLAKNVFKTRLKDDPSTWSNASPLSRISPDAPPFYVIHGKNDTLVPIEQAREFVATLRKVSQNKVCYAELPGAQHAFEVFWSPRTRLAVASILTFLTEILAMES